MWPIDPEDFVSLTVPPDQASRNEAWFFLQTPQGIVCLTEQGVPRPITGDELRWLDIEVHSEHYLGQFRGRCIYAVDAKGGVPEGYSAAGLREWLGRVATQASVSPLGFVP